ncbi:redox-sensing transcriptional repressor Rex [Aerococcus sp. JJEM-2022a]|uniref:redox-sensing transcriptional repressor Rex n=1 Tax=Aerococcus loyolae TaxID=2976809 RepID=UPI002278D809|nr:redox-sensing transcriptional repressor Rex [Aerococcus loyolae]MCY3028945.1 redox-sensing transcriptional repressor Rex [Aerococcus loyolae]
MKEIPRATARRLPLYYRYLHNFKNMGKTRIFSSELSEAIKVDSATIRRDFSHFGALGKRGYGYDVEALLDFFSRQLYQDRLTTVALIGVGNLGNALLNYNFKRTNNIRIGAAFDINPEIVGTVHSGVPVYPMSELKERIQEMEILIAIMTVPEKVAQDTVSELGEAGIQGILNFTPVVLDVPEDIHVQNVDLANELQTLIYYIGNRNGNNKKKN